MPKTPRCPAHGPMKAYPPGVKMPQGRKTAPGTWNYVCAICGCAQTGVVVSEPAKAPRSDDLS